jgi:hypothetical protein
LTCDRMQRHTSVMKPQIGELFEGLTHSGVSKADQGFSARMSGGEALRKAGEKIEKSLSNVKA